jgi:hypothetical protein
MIAIANYRPAADLVIGSMASLRASGPTDAARLAANLELVVTSLVALSQM